METGGLGDQEVRDFAGRRRIGVDGGKAAPDFIFRETLALFGAGDGEHRPTQDQAMQVRAELQTPFKDIPHLDKDVEPEHMFRTEERSVGKEFGSTCISRWSTSQ